MERDEVRERITAAQIAMNDLAWIGSPRSSAIPREVTRRFLFGLIAAPAVVPDTLTIIGREGPRVLFGRNLNPWMFLDFRRDSEGFPIGWCLSHRPTGLSLVTGLTRDAATKAADAFLPLANWNCTQEDVKAWPTEIKTRCAEIRDEAEGYDAWMAERGFHV